MVVKSCPCCTDNMEPHVDGFWFCRFCDYTEEIDEDLFWSFIVHEVRDDCDGIHNVDDYLVDGLHYENK